MPADARRDLVSERGRTCGRGRGRGLRRQVLLAQVAQGPGRDVWGTLLACNRCPPGQFLRPHTSWVILGDSRAGGPGRCRVQWSEGQGFPWREAVQNGAEVGFCVTTRCVPRTRTLVRGGSCCGAGPMVIPDSGQWAVGQPEAAGWAAGLARCVPSTPGFLGLGWVHATSPHEPAALGVRGPASAPTVRTVPQATHGQT